MALPSTDDIDMKKRFKCIIVGAGIAGLSAAKHLIKNNIKDFVILEAKDKIGGRILSANVGKNKVELGANWIHGVLGNPMYEIAMSHGLIDIVNVIKPHNVVAATEDGKQVPFPVLREIYAAYMCFLRRCEEYFLCQYLPPDGIQSVGEHINLEIALYLERIKDIKEKHLRHLIFCCLLKRETCISGCNSMNDIDLLELGSYTELQGGNIVLPSGYSSILQPVAHDIPEKSILLKHKVSKILWPGQTNQSESSSESDGSVNTVIEYGKKATSDLVGTQVLCENGLSLKADCVICSLPLGVLKENGTKLFVPPLPDCKMESIERLLFGTVDKIFLIYDRPFLNPDISEVLLLWENNNDQNKGDLSNSWYRKIYSFSKVTDTLLLGWVSGDEAIYMESLSDDVIAETCTKILKKFLNDPFVPKPKYTICSRWYSDPNFRGSYTTLAVGSSQADIECVAETIYSAIHPNKPVLLFAGEHTHNSFYSTVHGAYLSGRAAAQSIIRSEIDTTENEVVLECKDTSDLSSWIRSVSLE